MKNIAIYNVKDDNAIHFLRQHKAHKEHISISPATHWYEAITEDGETVGVLGILVRWTKLRVKCFYVAKEYRRQGIGASLLSFAVSQCEGVTLTAFATDDSRRLFERFGFEVKNVNKNGITFLERKPL